MRPSIHGLAKLYHHLNLTFPDKLGAIMPSVKKLVFVAIIPIFVFLIASLAILYRSETLSVPQSLTGCGHLVSIVEGEEAVEKINKLHWSGDVGVIDAIISEYVCGVRLWVSMSKLDAEKLVEMMANAIALYSDRGVLPLKILGKRVVGECTVYLVADASGQIHAFWGKGHIGVWVETATSDINKAVDIVEEVARYYKCT